MRKRRHITVVKNQIDYDKLAEAITKAQEKSEDVANQNKKFTSSTLALTASFAFRVMAFFGWIVMLLLLFGSVRLVTTFMWNSAFSVITNIFFVLFITLFLIILFLYSLLLWKSAKEIETEKDRNYIISVFSGVVSFVALIVAFIALFKGVG